MERLCSVALGLIVASAVAAGPAFAITPKLPLVNELSASPSSLSWPSSRSFEYRVRVVSGSLGSDFVFTSPLPSWGVKGVKGSPYSFGSARLDGPGSLIPFLSVSEDPAPWSCWRGDSALSQDWFRLTLGPNAATTIVVPATLAGARLNAPLPQTVFTIENGDDPRKLRTPVAVGGKPGMLITSKIPGNPPHAMVDRRPGQRFVLSGTTDPPAPNRRITFIATPTAFASSGFSLVPFRLASLKTRSDGTYRSGPLSLRQPGMWRITSKLGSAGRFSQDSSCGPLLRVGRNLGRPS